MENDFKGVISAVQDFRIKFDLPSIENDKDLAYEKARHLYEEVHELLEAAGCGNKIWVFDAMLDIQYLLGHIALYLNINADQYQRGFEAVHRANMSRSKGGPNKEGICKGEHYEPPEPILEKILEETGATGLFYSRESK